jgi:hypothetical protein
MQHQSCRAMKACMPGTVSDDPTWDEYAVLGSDIPLAAVEDACAYFPQFGEHPSVEDLVALLPNTPASCPSPGPEL